jgi:choline dehydrogenase-like flavoprotein
VAARLPYFRGAENQERGADEHHGTGGPLCVSDLRARHELHDAFIAGAQEVGHRFNPDFNGAEQDGVGQLQLTVRNMRRCSAAVAYLRPTMKRRNLRVEIHALTHRILDRAQSFSDRSNAEIRRRGILAGPSAQSDQDWLDHIRQTAGTTCHPTSTCMMGSREKAVVDTALRVHGVEGLRVVDASIMPAVISGNTNAAIIMIAEKGAEMILRAARHAGVIARAKAA